MRLGQLLSLAGYQNPTPELDGLEVKRVITDSRACQDGDLFIGMTGTQVDGGKFAPQAIAQGAIAAIVSRTALDELPDAVKNRAIAVDDVVVACSQLATAFYEYPAQKLKLVGVTGTNGKTTTTHLIEFLLQTQYAVALFGTLYTRWAGYSKTATHTTPFAVDLQAQLAEAIAAGCDVGLMEVSSHALAQQRVLGCPFEVTVFTNLTQDHLDYHKDLEDYFQAKALLFSNTYLQGRAIINLDDSFGQRLTQMISGQPIWTYSISNSQADFYTENLTYLPHGATGTLHTPQGAITFNSPLVGRFNVENMLAAIAAALHMGMSLTEVVNRLPEFKSVPGRVERVQVSDDQDVTVVVDYAHTPDSLENLLKAMRPFTQRELICVFGCGGDRDRTKRPLMGGIAARLADRVYVTSDNPRTEDPHRILEDVVVGVKADIGDKPMIVEGDRHKCIHLAIAEAKSGDTILIAGKGHEDYQIIGREKIHFDDREESEAALIHRQQSSRQLA
ncbi:UDP-N-acetylmuramoyl-L-alanyl-D-glutamate--2,6-diaminopimelate ligase [Pseudanabaena sp. FACHB-1998]|uniref:UDP-N-acetylmuramoyl-L-alanyl-D-glutamate--2, 6-diaminopimelate ligase n=1 Tax=Pseudanabaena sp. FACHB-1998 TaxID=2692858 RepID=UPI001681A8A2|nr:UDP-N-acetylmuramoyl-L-alanyl-D-glutamate--2,6-diaminopimelate ligase [Pseudanabaena sp. FACHB-1998]MBD2175836.1 UDP-N-acetylmuramoyl-L-alanyl-D-glutamate--2,6-diaminopimelate ligase [Pseudanabaena sp. FACHB-1998]